MRRAGYAALAERAGDIGAGGGHHLGETGGAGVGHRLGVKAALLTGEGQEQEGVHIAAAALLGHEMAISGGVGEAPQGVWRLGGSGGAPQRAQPVGARQRHGVEPCLVAGAGQGQELARAVLHGVQQGAMVATASPCHPVRQAPPPQQG